MGTLRCYTGIRKTTSYKSRNTPRDVIKLILLTGLALLAAVLIGSAMKPGGERALLHTLGGSYSLLAQQPDFTRMQMAEGGVLLTLTDGTERFVPMPVEFTALFGRGWLNPFRLVYGWKVGDDVYFVTAGAVDDRWGYVFSGDSSVGTEGLNVLKRVGGNAWYFSTRAE